MPNLKLFNYFRSSTSYRVRIALELKGLQYIYEPIHLLHNGGMQNSPAYRALSPIGGVPTLVHSLDHSEHVISQSFAIIEYLDEVYTETPSYFPKVAYEKAKIRQVCETINADIHPLQNLKVMHFLEKQFNATAEQKNQWLNRWITEGLTAVEKIITPFSGKYCFGHSITAADLFLIPQLLSAQRFGVDTSQFKILNEIDKNCQLLDAFKKAHPFRQIDTPEELKIP